MFFVISKENALDIRRTYDNENNSFISCNDTVNKKYNTVNMICVSDKLDCFGAQRYTSTVLMYMYKCYISVYGVEESINKDQLWVKQVINCPIFSAKEVKILKKLSAEEYLKYDSSGTFTQIIIGFYINKYPISDILNWILKYDYNGIKSIALIMEIKKYDIYIPKEYITELEDRVIEKDEDGKLCNIFLNNVKGCDKNKLRDAIDMKRLAMKLT